MRRKYGLILKNCFTKKLLTDVVLFMVWAMLFILYLTRRAQCSERFRREALPKKKARMKKSYKLYTMVEWMAPQVIAEERKIYKGVSANVDFYSGFVYSMLDLPAGVIHTDVCEWHVS